MLDLRLFAPLSLSLCAFAATAAADPGVFSGGDHFEATMGFLATSQDQRASGFVNNGGAPALGPVFRGAPYDRALGPGLRYDLRLVLSNVRMTAGVDIPLTSFDSGQASRDGTHDVAPRSMWSLALRFGLGAEFTVGPVTPFADLLGTVARVTTTVAVDGRATDYVATRFGFSARAGLRVHLRPWFFVTASGELGIVGPTLWGAEVGVGFRVGS